VNVKQKRQTRNGIQNAKSSSATFTVLHLLHLANSFHELRTVCKMGKIIRFYNVLKRSTFCLSCILVFDISWLEIFKLNWQRNFIQNTLSLENENKIEKTLKAKHPFLSCSSSLCIEFYQMSLHPTKKCTHLVHINNYNSWSIGLLYTSPMLIKFV